VPVGMNKKSAQAWRISLEAQADNEKLCARSRLVKDSAAQGSLGPGRSAAALSLLKDIEGAFDQAQHFNSARPPMGALSVSSMPQSRCAKTPASCLSRVNTVLAAFGARRASGLISATNRTCLTIARRR
jgi:hypothetical protein